jgi:CRISPR-associated endonuclease Csy4
MDHYIDIHLQPDPEFPPHQLMAALYTKLHRVFVQLQLDSVGVSFPGYQEKPPSLGQALRLIGPEQNLASLIAQPWLQGMHDHVDVKGLANVPKDAEHRRLRRVQAKSSPARLRRRLMRRHGLSEDQARERIPDTTAKVLRLPFVTLRSTSSGQAFPLFLQLGPPVPTAQMGVFNAYGLSSTATTPFF